MKLSEIWQTKKKPTISFELYPARNEKAEGKLQGVIDKLAACEPDLVSVTFGAGGKTRRGTHELVRRLKEEKQLEVLGYFAGYGLGPDDITSVLDGYRDLGVDNLLVVRGDVPEDDGFTPHPGSMAHASDLLGFVRSKGYDFFLGAAGYPEVHREAPSREKDLAYLKLKVEHGAEFIITQYVYDNELFFDFTARCEAAGIDVPIIAGVMPIYTLKMTESLARMCGATIPDRIRQGLELLPPESKAAVTEFGIALAIKQCRGLLRAGVPGLHFYTMDRARSVLAIVEQLRRDGLL
jgi:methylenetetrahydrofolate reductase (NADPH)